MRVDKGGQGFLHSMHVVMCVSGGMCVLYEYITVSQFAMCSGKP